MKSVLFTVTKSDAGGAQQWVLDQIENFRGRANIYVLTNRDGWLTAKLGSDVVLRTDVRIEKNCSFSFLFAFRSFIKANRIDVVVASSANAGLYARLACFLARVRAVYISHGWSAYYNTGRLRPLFLFLEWLLSIITYRIVCVSESDRVVAEEKIHISPKKLKVILSGVNQCRESDGVISETPKVVMVARFQYPKRQDLLIEALKSSDYELFLVGMSEDQALPSVLGYENIHFCGLVQDFADYADYDIFCLISESEGLPLSAIEAMSAGLPLILSDVGGCCELISGNGVLVDNSARQILNAVNLCVLNYSEYAEQSRALYRAKFALNTKASEYYQLYFNV